MSSGVTEPIRVVSLDQFRGYTVLGMFFVNFLGRYEVIPEVLKHHPNYASYADTIMPQFFFAVGFAYRLTLLRRLRVEGPSAAYGRMFKRCLGLILLGIVVYQLDGGVANWNDLKQLGVRGFLTSAFQRNIFQTLVHIAVTSIWIMPVIAAGPLIRVAFAIFSGILHFVLSQQFYYDWVMTRPGIDGGPLGFLTWSIPTLAGSLVYDAVIPLFRETSVKPKAPAVITKLVGWGSLVMLLGYAFACLNAVTSPNDVEIKTGISSYLTEPPFVPPQRPMNIWTMSQRAGSLSYQTFEAGLSLVVFAVFLWACDVAHFRIGLFTTLGSNALAAYIIHDMVAEPLHHFAPRDAPLWYAISTFFVFLLVCYVFIRFLEKNKLFLRL